MILTKGGGLAPNRSHSLEAAGIDLYEKHYQPFACTLTSTELYTTFRYWKSEHEENGEIMRTNVCRLYARLRDLF